MRDSDSVMFMERCVFPSFCDIMMMFSITNFTVLLCFVEFCNEFCEE